MVIWPVVYLMILAAIVLLFFVLIGVEKKVDVDKKITGKADHGKKMWHLICWNDAHGVAILILIALLGLQILTVIRS